MTDPLESRVLRAMAVGLDSVDGIRISLNAAENDVRAALAQLVQHGLVVADEGGIQFVLTPAGQQVAMTGGLTGTSTRARGRGRSRSRLHWTQTSHFQMRVGTGPDEPGWREIGGMVAKALDASQSARSAELQRSDEEMLVGDVEREAALGGLSQAYGDGRLTQAELDRRTDLVLHARTRGDLDLAYDDLPKTADRPDRGSTRRTIFAVVALLSIPVVVLGLLLLGADETGGKVFGAALLVGPALCLLILAPWAFSQRPARVRRHWHH